MNITRIRIGVNGTMAERTPRRLLGRHRMTSKSYRGATMFSPDSVDGRGKVDFGLAIIFRQRRCAQWDGASLSLNNNTAAQRSSADVTTCSGLRPVPLTAGNILVGQWIGPTEFVDELFELHFRCVCTQFRYMNCSVGLLLGQ